MSKGDKRKKTRQRKGKYPVSSILPLLLKYDWKKGKVSQKVFIDGDKVQCCSVRLTTFLLSGTKCLCCGLEGEYFTKERVGEEPYHLNLYGTRNGKRVLLTSDHIVPLGMGGRKNSRDNRQTLCARCNSVKGSEMVSNEELYEKVKRWTEDRIKRSKPVW